ncbi:hypothetical protein Tcan_13810 [Toxocara canis]|uniref:VWFA domain-containing protein n=1 Tax=Toxocara canis TaxID=6265 RepID=A0A0B2VIS2_TOXCA|nr:hypothetical protein Tcan_13810 [Toxocara canis]
MLEKGIGRWDSSKLSGAHKTRKWLSPVGGTPSISASSPVDKCFFRGIDMTAYVDDSAAMPETEFYRLRHFLRQFHHLFESDRRKCQQVSRLAVLKNRPNGSVFTYLQLDDSLDRLRTSVHLSKMEYAGCDLELNPLCRSAVANAYVLATTLHSLDSVDRKRAVMFLTSRTSAQIHSIEYDLREAVKYAARNLFEVYALSIGEQSSEGEIGSFVSAPTLKNANMIHGLNGRIVPRSLPFVLLGI